MNIIKNTENLLASIRDGISRLVNGKQVVGYQVIDLLSASVSSLTVPAGATEALIMVERASPAAADSYSIAIRFSVTDTVPETGAYIYSAGPPVNPIDGMPWLSMNPLVIKGADALKAFKVIAAATTTSGQMGLKVIYYR